MYLTKNLFSLLLLCCYVVTLSQTYNNQKNTNTYFLFKDLENEKLNDIYKKLDSLTTHTLPKDAILIKHKAYYAAYSKIHKQAYWVAHILPKDILYGSYTRNDGFILDSLYLNTADSTDYWGSGYDRGHLAPAGDFRWHKDAMYESFYYTNVAPQIKDFNRGTWAKLETKVREFAIDNDELYIITGAVLKDVMAKIPQGSYSVSIPKYFYKIIYDLQSPDYKAIAFLMPNQSIPFDLEKYMVSVDSIESLTKIDFLPILDDAIENKIEHHSDIYQWDKNYKTYVDSIALMNFGKGKINSIQAKDNIGKNCTVCGKAVSIKFVQNNKSNPTYINFDKAFPDQVFTIVINETVRKQLGYIPEEVLSERTICVSGKIAQYKGIPQIYLNKPEDLEILK